MLNIKHLFTVVEMLHRQMYLSLSQQDSVLNRKHLFTVVAGFYLLFDL